MELSEYSLVELRRLKSRIEAEIQRQSTAARRNLLKQIKKMAAEEGLSLTDVMADASESEPRKEASPKRRAKRITAKKTGVAAAKALRYRHPENPRIGWSGRGRKPGWVIDWLAQNKPLEALEVKSD